MAETRKVDREPPWKFPLEHRSASSSPLASPITLSFHGDGLEDREEDGPGRTTSSDRPRLITEVDAKPPSPPPSFRREETSSPSKRLKFDDPSARREQPDERKPARAESKGRSSGKPRGSSAGGEPKGKKLACPYFKQNQRREGRPVACIHPGFSNVARLKEHLYRIHKLPAICPRCQAQFDTEEEVTDHLNAPERCEKQPRKAHLEGFDREQELKLRTKKRSKGEGSEEEKWRGVFMILFPNASLGEVPSAYVEPDTRLGSPDCADQEARVLDGFEEFSRRKMPHVVSKLEPTLVGERIEPQQLLELLQACQRNLFESYRYRNITRPESVPGRRFQSRSRSGSKSCQSSDGHMKSPRYECSDQSPMCEESRE